MNLMLNPVERACRHLRVAGGAFGNTGNGTSQGAGTDIDSDGAPPGAPVNHRPSA